MSYIAEAEYAVRNLFDLIHGEQRELAELRKNLHEQNAIAAYSETEFTTSQ